MTLPPFGWQNTLATPLSAAELEAFGLYIANYFDNGSSPFGTPNSVVTASRTLKPSGGDDTSQIQAAINAGGVTFLAPGTYTQSGTLDLNTGGIGGALVALGGTSRWRPNVAPPVIINYTGNSNAVQINGSVQYDNFTVRGIRWDGASAGASSVGLLLQTANVGNVYIEGLLFEDCGFTNFGLNQIVLSGQVFDITFRRVVAHNTGHGTDNVISVTAQGSYVPSQLMWLDCWLVQSQNSKWAYFQDVSANVSTRFLGGTVTTGNAAGAANTSANGIHCLGHLSIVQTHIESCALGVEWAGPSATIMSDEIVSNTTGVAIGSSLNTALQANGAFVQGIQGNTTDILVRTSGSRANCVVQMAQSTVLSDLRQSSDGVNDVSYLGRAQSSAGTATGYSAGTTAVTFHSDDKYTGNIGANGYTINGIVAALKTVGILTQ